MSQRLDLYVRCDLPVPVAVEQWQSWFSAWLHHLAFTEPCELSLILTDDDCMQTLNRQFRGIDCPTDVLAFAAREVNFSESAQSVSDVTGSLPTVMLGDIVVSVPIASRQAIGQQHSLADELIWLAAHGLLHVLGWDHPDESSLQAMIRKQRELLEVIQLCQVV